jgi:hypothetical protein
MRTHRIYIGKGVTHTSTREFAAPKPRLPTSGFGYSVGRTLAR